MSVDALALHLDTLLAVPPGTDEATAAQHAIESLLMGALRSGGQSAGEAMVESLSERGHALERLDALPCMWRLRVPSPQVLEIWFTGGAVPVVAAVSYRVGEPWGSRSQRLAAKRQAAFYARYASARAQAEPLSDDDRLILVVAQVEAELNNGGFGQLLSNVGEQEARDAHAALGLVGARRTARWLAAAFDADAETRARLDRQFAEKGEDLASLTMRYLSRRR